MKNHMLKPGFNVLTVCGDINGYKTKSPRTTDCGNCKRTKAYRDALETLKGEYTVRGEDAWNLIESVLDANK